MAEIFASDRREDGFAVVSIDVPGESQNTLQAQFIEQANDMLNQLERDRALKGVVIASSKPGSFIAGADISMLMACQTSAEAAELARAGQRFFNRIAGFKVPVVAAIDGACLGGGLELALACHGRICSDSAKTRLGLPEVQLGLLPGSGGTQRLPRLIGIPKALDLMLTGRHLRPEQAKRIGLVDDVVPAIILMTAALKRLQALGKRANPRKNNTSQWLLQWGLEKIPKARSYFFDQARKRALARTHGNYPAPERIIDTVETGIAQGFEAGLEVEARNFGELALSEQAKQLMTIYFATTEMKKDSGVEDGVEMDGEIPRVKKIGVLGAGLMGAGISYVSSSRAEVSVRLKDKDSESLNRGLGYVHRLIQQRLKRRALSVFEAGQQQRRVTATLDYSGFQNVDLVIEAVFEDLALKQQMLRDIEQYARQDTIFASNTSSIPIADIAEAAQRPQNVIGMHYFSPVEKMPLLEIIATPKTRPEMVACAVEFGRRQGKTVIVVKDGAGFYVNRILAPYINEAGYLLQEGVSIDAIDKAMVKFGFPVGPFALLDEVGIDVGAKVAPILVDAFGARMQPTRAAETMLADGRTGKKTGKGFYRYDDKKAKQVDASVYSLLGVSAKQTMTEKDISERCVLPLLNEAARCLEEGVIRSKRDGDIGAVFGIGFPPFRGGPFRYADAIGIENLVSKLQTYQKRHGERFAPAPLLLQLAEQGRSLHS